jgi:hypothetical protein
MSHIVGSVNRKPQASTQQHSTDQRGLGLIGAVRTAPVEADADFIRRSSWDGTMRYAVQRSGMDDYEVADEMNVSHGHFSKVMKGAAGLWGHRLVKFMRVTGSVAPLQWLADQMGYEIRPKTVNQRIADLEAELERERAKAERAA